jgi:hypothetical protein
MSEDDASLRKALDKSMASQRFSTHWTMRMRASRGRVVKRADREMCQMRGVS